MALREIRLEGDEILRKKSKPVKDITDSLRTLLDDMRDTMKKHDGVGLAAPQVGALRRAVIILNGEEVVELINPEITETEGEQLSVEGCLSVVGRMGKVERPARVVVKALNRDGDEFTFEGTERVAVAVCHEINHLDGILFVDIAKEVYEPNDDEDEDDDVE